MPIYVEQSQGEVPEIEDGIYLVKCIGVAEKVMENDQFGNVDKIEIRLQFLDLPADDDDHPVMLDPLVNRKLNERSTLWKYAEAFGIDPSIRPFDAEAMIGRTARVVITNPTPGGWPKVSQIMKAAAPARRPAVAATKPVSRAVGGPVPVYRPAPDVVPCEHEAAYTPDGHLVCRTCGVALEESPV